MLYINADDLGWNEEITDRILECYRHGSISSASIMTFMKDSERAAGMARENGLHLGLHLNFTHEFTDKTVATKIRDWHRSIKAYLKAWKLNQIFFNPFLIRAFDYVFQAQWDEFLRIYGERPTHLDGHEHMHLCMNMLFSVRLPKRLKVRRNFTFSSCEKNTVNRLYRVLVDCWLKSRFICTDFFFSMTPIDRERLQRIVLLSKSKEVELMVHPGVKKEYRYLLSEDWLNLLKSRIC